MSWVYAGIGPRSIGPRVVDSAMNAGWLLADAGHTLRTGGAVGADNAFLRGCLKHPASRYELFLPWAGYCDLPLARATLVEPAEEAFVIAARYHPAWERCSQGARKLLARNAHVILGRELAAPVDLVVVPRRTTQGGTGHALRLVAGEAPGARVVELDELAALL